MKKLTVLFLAMALLLCSCGSKLPNGVTQAVYDYGVETIDIIDKYFAGELSRDDAYTQIYDLVSSYNKDRGHC